jgi:hypothetical protein
MASYDEPYGCITREFIGYKNCIQRHMALLQVASTVEGFMYWYMIRSKP